MVCETKESSFQKSPTDSLLGQLSEHQTDDLEVVSSNPSRGNVLTKFILCCITLDLSDNLTETRTVKNSIVHLSRRVRGMQLQFRGIFTSVHKRPWIVITSYFLFYRHIALKCVRIG